MKRRRMSNLMGCYQLKRLSLDVNHLTELPDFPISLEKISVQHNRLRYLPGPECVKWEAGKQTCNRKSILVQSSMSCNVYIVNHGTLSNPCLASWFQTPLVLWIKQLHMRLWVLAQCVPELCEEFFGRKSHKAAKSSRPFPNRQLPHGAASQHWTAQEFEGWRAANICCTCVRLQAFKNTLNEQQEWCGRIAFLPSSCLTSIRVHMQDPVKT
jgi:hypothetical protein